MIGVVGALTAVTIAGVSRVKGMLPDGPSPVEIQTRYETVGYQIASVQPGTTGVCEPLTVEWEVRLTDDLGTYFVCATEALATDRSDLPVLDR